jgi:hypothetical protein
VAGCCEHGNEPSRSIKGRELLDKLNVLLASEDGICSMESMKVISKLPEIRATGNVHVPRMEETSNACIILMEKLLGKLKFWRVMGG